VNAGRWLVYKAIYSSIRGAHLPVGTHAFPDGVEHSLCGCASRSRAGDEALADARRCTKCERLAAGRQPVTRHDAKPVKRPTLIDPRPRPTCPVCGASGTEPCRGLRGRARDDHEMRSSGPVGRMRQVELTVRAHRRLCRAARAHGVTPAAMLEILAMWSTFTTRNGR